MEASLAKKKAKKAKRVSKRKALAKKRAFVCGSGKNVSGVWRSFCNQRLSQGSKEGVSNRNNSTGFGKRFSKNQVSKKHSQGKKISSGENSSNVPTTALGDRNTSESPVGGSPIQSAQGETSVIQTPGSSVKSQRDILLKRAF